MMRLIDADLLMERIKSNDDLPWNLDKIMQTAFESCVRHSPTAYDVDKVVEQLMEILYRNRYCDSQYDDGYADGVENTCEEAMEIVKKGGIE